MKERDSDVERMRRELHRALDRAGTLGDPGLLELAQRLDRLIVEEMRKGRPEIACFGEHEGWKRGRNGGG